MKKVWNFTINVWWGRLGVSRPLYDLLEEKQYAYATRNHIVHEYDGVDKYIIEEVIKTHLPQLKIKLLSFHIS